ncbi:MAG: tRNA dihydrouridine synthase DusB, partial [Clostridia bacterium]|nr:tRNA dihydrouridine synthase DusB [Clostridia bacterium]
MEIDKIKLETPVITAPMAGITDKAFREILKSMGAAMVCTEMVSDKALIYSNKNTLELLDIEGEEYPVCVQLFGSEPDVMAKAAKIIYSKGAHMIDINMGCPAPKIVRNGEGSALMRNPELAQEIVGAVVRAVPIPVTVKIRKGWDANSVNAVEVARLAEEAGA